MNSQLILTGKMAQIYDSLVYLQETDLFNHAQYLRNAQYLNVNPVLLAIGTQGTFYTFKSLDTDRTEICLKSCSLLFNAVLSYVLVSMVYTGTAHQVYCT